MGLTLEGRVLSPAKSSVATGVMGIGSRDLVWDKGPRGGEARGVESPEQPEDGCPGKGAGFWERPSRQDVQGVNEAMREGAFSQDQCPPC